MRLSSGPNRSRDPPRRSLRSGAPSRRFAPRLDNRHAVTAERAIANPSAPAPVTTTAHDPQRATPPRRWGQGRTRADNGGAGLRALRRREGTGGVTQQGGDLRAPGISKIALQLGAARQASASRPQQPERQLVHDDVLDHRAPALAPEAMPVIPLPIGPHQLRVAKRIRRVVPAYERPPARPHPHDARCRPDRGLASRRSAPA